MFESRYRVMVKSRLLYHFVLFISFIGAVLLLPIINNFIAIRITQVLLRLIITYFIAYVGAMYIFPEVVCSIFLMGEDN